MSREKAETNQQIHCSAFNSRVSQWHTNSIHWSNITRQRNAVIQRLNYSKLVMWYCQLAYTHQDEWKAKPVSLSSFKPKWVNSLNVPFQEHRCRLSCRKILRQAFVHHSSRPLSELSPCESGYHASYCWSDNVSASLPSVCSPSCRSQWLPLIGNLSPRWLIGASIYPSDTKTTQSEPKLPQIIYFTPSSRKRSEMKMKVILW